MTFEDFCEDMADAVSDAVDSCVDLVEDIGEAVSNAIGDISSAIADIAGAAADIIGDALSCFGDFIDGIGDFLETSADFFEAIIRTLESAGNNVAHFLDDLVSTIVRSTQDMWEGLSSLVEDVWNGLGKLVVQAWEGIFSIIEEVSAALVNIAENALGPILRFIENATISFFEVLMGFLEMVIECIVEPVLEFFACISGISVYFAAKAGNASLNAFKARHFLPDTFKTKLQKLFDNTSFDSVCYVEGANLIANAFDPKSETKGMTFGPDTMAGVVMRAVVYLKSIFDENDYESRKTMVHELVHVKQIDRYGGEIGFACEYGKGYVSAGLSYEGNPLEEEAYDFTKDHDQKIKNL